jgi:hypothetical protein
MNFPFDVNHIYIHKYRHLGEDLGYKEAMRFRKELTELVQKVTHSEDNDSPVYTFLAHLPRVGFIEAARAAARTSTQVEESGASLRDVIETAKAAMREDRFCDAIEHWRQEQAVAGKNDYIVQQLALATYKCRKPDAKSALRDAEKILEYLKPHTSFDTETLGLWAAVHKRRFELDGDSRYLEEALFALERGFFIKRDYYNGINLAFILDTKASSSAPEIKTELRGVASYVRRRVKEICDEALKASDMTPDQKYCVLATLYEASVGLEEEGEVARWKKESETVATADWMRETTVQQVAKLRVLRSAS